MSPAEKEALIVKLFELLGRFERRLAEIEAKVEKTSRNSNQPPSADGLKKVPARSRPRGGKTPAGQPGHQGSTRQMVENPDRIQELRPMGPCPACGAALEDQPAILKERRQQFDLPKPMYVVTEYRQFQVQCGCGQRYQGEFPEGITSNVSFGPHLKAYAVGLVEGHLVSLERAAELSGDQYGLRPSDGTIQQWLRRAAATLMPVYEETRQALVRADVVHFDESGVRQQGRLPWLHVAATADAVHYSVHPRRGREGMDAAGILPHFQGTAVHDHWKPYWHYQPGAHSLCNAHHLRELRYFEATTGHAWPTGLMEVLSEAHTAVKAAQAAGQTAVDRTLVDTLQVRYDTFVANGLKVFPERAPPAGSQRHPKQHPATNLLRRLRDFKTAVWRFLTDWRVPFDNNRAERRVRPAKVKLKVAGGFRAVGGAQAFCILRSVWETNKIQPVNPFSTLRRAFKG
jgi:transposase